MENLSAVKKYQSLSPDKYKAEHLITVKKNQSLNPDKYKAENLIATKKYQMKIATQFPPPPLSNQLQHTIISRFCDDMQFNKFEESGCAVCGKLTLLTELQKLSDLDLDLNILYQQGVTQVERHFPTDPLIEIQGPVLDNDLDTICQLCYKSVSKGKMPVLALANGIWLGKVPHQLQNLSYAEQLLVA